MNASGGATVGIGRAGRRSAAVAFAALLAASPLAASPSASSVTAPEPLAHEWRSVDGKHWQIVSTNVEDVTDTDLAEGNRGRCSEGMVEVEGRMVLDHGGDFDPVDGLQQSVCTRWINRNFPERCARFDEARWALVSRGLERQKMHFCIDRFEYPNRRGAYPWILVNWAEAGRICAAESKRLCTEAEWTFACEGEDAAPYPYGYDRDPDACVIDRPWRVVDASALSARDGDRARAEVDRLWQGEASGARPRCKSPFGVYDMTGNVDEWTTSVAPRGRRSVLKGGYWGPVRTRCRPSTRIHAEDYAFYQQGLRCCSDVPDDSTKP